MFFQSVFMNFGIGVTFYLILSPFILNAYFKYSELFDYYLYCLGGIFIMALLYIIQLDMKQVLDNSLSNKKRQRNNFFLLLIRYSGHYVNASQWYLYLIL